MKHVAHGLPADIMEKCDNEEDLQGAAEVVETAYWACLEALGNQDHDIAVSYNILLTQKFILLVNRKQEAVKMEGCTVGVNCLGFGGTLAVKRESDLEYLKTVSPLKILHLVSMEQ